MCIQVYSFISESYFVDKLKSKVELYYYILKTGICFNLSNPLSKQFNSIIIQFNLILNILGYNIGLYMHGA